MKRLIVIGLALAAALSGVLLYQVGKYAEHGGPATFEQLTVLPGGRVLPDFSMIDQSGKAFSRADFSGRWSVLFFGFTHCPDICPTTLYQLAQMRKAMDDLAPTMQPAIYMVSVDVARDTPEVMAQYVQSFDSGFTGLTGEADQLQRLAMALGAAYGIEPGDDGGYDVLHTAALFLLNSDGDYVAVASPPHDFAALARDYRKLLTTSGRQ